MSRKRPDGLQRLQGSLRRIELYRKIQCNEHFVSRLLDDAVVWAVNFMMRPCWGDLGGCGDADFIVKYEVQRMSS